MPYDPAFPVANALITSAAFRSQFTGLFDLIQAVPPGPQGPPFAQAVVDGVSTGNPGDAAAVQVSFDGTNVHFSFSIPRGNDGSSGAPGSGVSGATVDSVSTANPGDPAQASASFDGSSIHFTFAIPRGGDGSTGPQGPPGEVTSSQFNAAFANTSANSNPVTTLDTPFANDPPTLADMELMRAKMNELIVALRRS